MHRAAGGPSALGSPEDAPPPRVAVGRPRPVCLALRELAGLWLDILMPATDSGTSQVREQDTCMQASMALRLRTCNA
jgi:hypothetical protein